MDWGLGNPNKTAILIGCLLILAWLPVRKERWGFWLTWALTLGLGICLIHTYSRGGLVDGGGFGRGFGAFAGFAARKVDSARSSGSRIGNLREFGLR